jgi:hypothetical protein
MLELHGRGVKGSRFCNRCGAALPVRCRECAHGNAAGSRFARIAANGQRWLSDGHPVLEVCRLGDVRRGAGHGEAIAGRAGEGRGDRPAGVGELVLLAQPDREVELLLVAEADRASEVGADGRAKFASWARRVTFSGPSRRARA